MMVLVMVLMDVMDVLMVMVMMVMMKPRVWLEVHKTSASDGSRSDGALARNSKLHHPGDGDEFW